MALGRQPGPEHNRFGFGMAWFRALPAPSAGLAEKQEKKLDKHLEGLENKQQINWEIAHYQYAGKSPTTNQLKSRPLAIL